MSWPAVVVRHKGGSHWIDEDDVEVTVEATVLRGRAGWSEGQVEQMENEEANA